MPSAWQPERLHSRRRVGWHTVIIALAAGVAGMLSFETRASFAVGVAISVTTIPAAATWASPPASASGRPAGAAAVLGVNLAVLLVAGTRHARPADGDSIAGRRLAAADPVSPAVPGPSGPVVYCSSARRARPARRGEVSEPA